MSQPFELVKKEVAENRSESFDLAGMKPMIGMPIMDGKKAWETENSLLQTRQAIAKMGLQMEERFVVGCSIIELARTKVLLRFLESDCTHLFMIDADMVWRPEDFIRLLALGTKLPCVGGAYPAKREPATFMLRWEDSELIANEYGCLPIRGMGLGFTIVQRMVIEDLIEGAPKMRFVDEEGIHPHFFRNSVENGEFQGEDMAFFQDVRELGYTVWMDPAISLGHVGTKVYRGSIRDAMKAV